MDGGGEATDVRADQEGAEVESGRPHDLPLPADSRQRGGGGKKEAPNRQSRCSSSSTKGSRQVSETRTKTTTRTRTRTTARTRTRTRTTSTGPDPECAADLESADRQPALRYDRTRWSASPPVGPSVEVGRVVDPPLSRWSQSTLLRPVGLRSRLFPKG